MTLSSGSLGIHTADAIQICPAQIQPRHRYLLTISNSQMYVGARPHTHAHTEGCLETVLPFIAPISAECSSAVGLQPVWYLSGSGTRVLPSRRVNPFDFVTV